MPYNRTPREVYWKKRKKRQKRGRGGTERGVEKGVETGSWGREWQERGRGVMVSKAHLLKGDIAMPRRCSQWL